MARFIQIVEYSTTRFAECQALAEQFRTQQAANPDRKPVSVTVTRNRDVADRYATIVEFDSYEDAMANSNRPETGEFAAAMGKLCDGPPVFHNLDLMDQYRV